MQAVKFPVVSMLGQALAALFRARTHLHPVTILVFLAAVAVMAGVLFSVVGKSSVEIYVALTRLNLFVLPVLAIFGFWLYRRYRLRPLGAKRPLVAFLQMILFSIMLTLMMTVFTLIGGVSIFAGVTLFNIDVSNQFNLVENMMVFLFAAPAIFAGFLMFVRLLPGLALAARGEGFDLPRTWGVLRGNYWRFFLTMFLFNALVNTALLLGDGLLAAYGEQVAVTRDFNVPQFYVLLLVALFVHMWNAAGIAFLTSRACDMAEMVPAAAAPVAEPVVVAAAKPAAAPKQKAVKKAPAKKAAVKKAEAKAAAKPVAKPAAKKAAPQKPAVKKAAAAKKPVVKKTAAKKPVAKKTTKAKK